MSPHDSQKSLIHAWTEAYMHAGCIPANCKFPGQGFEQCSLCLCLLLCIFPHGKFLWVELRFYQGIVGACWCELGESLKPIKRILATKGIYVHNVNKGGFEAIVGTFPQVNLLPGQDIQGKNSCAEYTQMEPFPYSHVYISHAFVGTVLLFPFFPFTKQHRPI